MPANEVLITRVFDAPRALVFQAWTDPEHLARWHAPRGCTIQFRTFDFRPGGEFISYLKTPENYECLCKGVYREIVVPERIVYTIAFCDDEGNFVEPAAKGMDPEWPGETTVTVTFSEREGKTTLTLHQSVLESLAKRTGAHPSWIQMLDRLAETLPPA
ncbi:MAG: SRPBCC domain-containing protein [Acidobacteriota bacterium]